MGFFKDLGEIAGGIVGGVVGGVTMGIGEIIESEFVKEIGESVATVSVNAGKTVGQAADGVAGVAVGIISDDSKMVEDGFSEIGDSATRTITGVCNGVGHIVESGVETIEGIVDGDEEKIVNGAKKLVKVAAVSALAVGVGDYVGIIGDDMDGVDYSAHDFDTDGIDVDVDGDGMVDVHDVDPHYVSGHFRDGEYVEGYWRDGDGDTSVDLNKAQGGGYLRSNPDGIKHNNLG